MGSASPAVRPGGGRRPCAGRDLVGASGRILRLPDVLVLAARRARRPPHRDHHCGAVARCTAPHDPLAGGGSGRLAEHPPAASAAAHRRGRVPRRPRRREPSPGRLRLVPGRHLALDDRRPVASARQRGADARPHRGEGRPAGITDPGRPDLRADDGDGFPPGTPVQALREMAREGVRRPPAGRRARAAAGPGSRRGAPGPGHGRTPAARGAARRSRDHCDGATRHQRLRRGRQ